MSQLMVSQSIDQPETEDTDSLSGSDFTLYSSEALTDEAPEELDIRMPTSVSGQLINIEDTSQPNKSPKRPPPPKVSKKLKRPSEKKSQTTIRKKHEERRENELRSSSIEDLADDSKGTPPRRRKTSRATEKSLAPAARSAEIRVTTPSEKTKTKQKGIPSPNALLKTIQKMKKSAKKEIINKVPVSRSKEEFRAAGDGASEDNELDEATSAKAHTSKVKFGLQSRKPVSYTKSSSIDTEAEPRAYTTDTAESGRDQTDSSDDSSEATTPKEVPKSSQWLDFQAMADRISTTVQNTSKNIKNIAQTTNVTKLVGGVIKEPIPKSNSGAWEVIDQQKEEDSSDFKEFEDDYDPEAEADTVGQAFGDYQKNKKQKRDEKPDSVKEFESNYNPEVDVNDPLASAFGDGMRTSKQQTVSTAFDDDFSSGKMAKKEDKEKHSKKSLQQSSSKPNPAKNSQPEKSKPARPQVSPGTQNKAKPARPTASPSMTAKTKPARPDKAASPRKKENVAEKPTLDLQSTDLLGSIDPDQGTTQMDEDPASIVIESSSTVPSNFDLLMGAVSQEEEEGFKDNILSEFEPEPVKNQPPDIILHITEEGGDLPSRSSSADLLDAFEFFDPNAKPEPCIKEPSYPSVTNLTAPSIQVIGASSENLASDDEMSYIPTMQANHSHSDLGDLDPLSQKISDGEELESESEDDGESDSDQSGSDHITDGKLIREDTVDFDEILHRPGATDKPKAPSACDVWQDTEDSGIGGEFRATFSVEDDLAETNFAGNDTFESLIEKYSSSDSPRSKRDAFTAPQSKGKAEIKSDGKVSEKRAMRFARTFSETIDEDDSDIDENNPLSPKASTGLGLVVDPLDAKREAADGEEEENDEKGPSSARHVWIDMTKPMPRAQAKQTKSESKTSVPVSSIKLVSQAARQNKQVVTKSVPRPKGKEQARDENLEPTTTSAKKPSATARKLVTQGQADNLTLKELNEHTTLTFEINKRKKKKKKGHPPEEPVIVPVLPPPPKTVSPAPTRKNPFNKSDSSSSEEEPQLLQLNEEKPKTKLVAQPEYNTVNSEIEEMKDTECLLGSSEGLGDGVQATKEFDWDALEKVHLEPLEEFRPKYEGHGWKMLLRKPPKKSLTKKRFWEEVYVRIEADDKGVPCLLLYRHEKDAMKGAKELERTRLNPYHQLGESIYLQQLDQYGKCHCVKILHVSYKERPSLRTDRMTEALPSFIKGYMKPNKNTLFEHAPTVNELYKFGNVDYRAVRMFVWELEDAMMKLRTERVNTNTMYQKNEIVADAWDEYEACIDKDGHIVNHKARVRLFICCFVSGMPIVEVGINDKRRRGKEIVRRHEIIPVKAENWIHVEDVELHHLVKKQQYEGNGVISFVPLDACKFEFMRFRYRPKKNRELPLQISTKMVVDREKRKVEIRADVLIPGYYSNSKRKGQVPLENIQICFPIPEVWIYKFRVEKHQKYGSVHAATRKPGKVKGIERITTAFGKAAESYLPPSFIECSVGDAKYEHIFHSVVWRIDRLPRFNEGAYKQHYFALRLELGKHDAIPDSFEPQIQVEFTMPHTTVSGTAVRSISCSDLDEPPEKWVHHHARYEYSVEIDFQSEIKELLPNTETLRDDIDSPKVKHKSPVKQPDQEQEAAASSENAAESDDSSIEVNDDRTDSDDTDSEADSGDEDRPDASNNADSSQGYETLVDLHGDDEGGANASAPLLMGGGQGHLSELLDFTEMTAEDDPSQHHNPVGRRASLQKDDLDFL